VFRAINPYEHYLADPNPVCLKTDRKNTLFASNRLTIAIYYVAIAFIRNAIATISRKTTGSKLSTRNYLAIDLGVGKP
jgi:hypothetical protein